MSSRTKWISTLLLLLLFISIHVTTSTSPSHDFEGFGDDEFDLEPEHEHESDTIQITNPPPPLTLSKPLTQTQSPPSDQPPPVITQTKTPSPTPPVSVKSNYWDEDEFEGLPVEEVTDLREEVADVVVPDVVEKVVETVVVESAVVESGPLTVAGMIKKFAIEIVCVAFLVIFAINYFTGKKENENLALSWAAKFAAKDSIFEKNFSLLGVGEDDDDSPLLLKEGQNVFKFYASGRRYCQGVLATMELKSRHDLISRLYNSVVQCKDEIGFEVYMNDESMDQVVFAIARKKMAKAMWKELSDLQRFASVMAVPTGRKWVTEELSVVTERKEVAGDLISDAVLDQVFSEKAFEKLGKYFISMHFSDQQSGPHRKKLMFKFALPDIEHMADMSRLVALVPYYIDFVGRYKLSSQARTKTDAARAKVAQEVYKEMQNARQEALLRKKADKKKMIEEAEAKLSAESIRKKDAKERAKRMKKGMPKMKMTRA